jgi:hypothetical protein
MTEIFDEQAADNEVWYALVGSEDRSLWWGALHHRVDGEIATVTGDAAWVLEREEICGDVIGMYHTHPHWPAIPSGRDIKSMRAWAVCFGRAMLCLIDGIDGLRAWWIDDDDETPLECQVVRHDNGLIFGTTEVDAALFGADNETDELKLDDEGREQVMPKVNGVSFRCRCGCNVFTKVDELRYSCNGCEALYLGEK